MTTDTAALGIIGAALWNPKETKDDQESRHLAEALGYPEPWRVVRKKCNDRFVDRIYAGDPSAPCDMWLSHAGAMEAAALWENTNQTPFEFHGGHLLPLQPKFAKSQKVQVLYEGEWWDAKIVKVKSIPGSFIYQVYYPFDNSKQSGVEESNIREMVDVDPETQATKLGFPESWKAYSLGSNRWKLVSPEGEIFHSKKAALESLVVAPFEAVDEGDPPWRKTGHDYVGRKICYEYTHKVSARRTVAMVQVGTITGWISETDVDKEGKPGFVDKEGKPAKLFHVVFEADKTSLYVNHMLAEQDFEQYEVELNMLTEEEAPPKKKAKR